MKTEKTITSSVKIKEIFTSIQGEGPYVGVNQLFIRFCKCNLNCKYCDTDFNGEMEFSPELLKIFIENKLNTVHSISLTGGEPLLFADFLSEFLPMINKTIYLETNATLSNELKKIINFVDIISADIKLPSSTGMKPLWNEHDRFFNVCRQNFNSNPVKEKSDKIPEVFAKVVFNKKIAEDEIDSVVNLCEKYNLNLILQPETKNEKINVDSETIKNIFNKFLLKYKKTRLIPQVHKFLDVE